MSISDHDLARHAGAARALQPYGFTIDPRYADGLRRYEPFAELTPPETYVTALWGTIEGARVELYEYLSTTMGTTTPGPGGHSQTTHSTTEVAVVVVQHPAIRGTASFSADIAAWGTAGKIANAIMWIPPFTIIKALQAINNIAHPLRHLGDSAFESAYKIHGASDAAVAEAIPAALRNACLQGHFHGNVEIRPGLLIYSSVDDLPLDEKHAVQLVGFAAAFLGAYLPHGAHAAP